MFGQQKKMNYKFKAKIPHADRMNDKLNVENFLWFISIKNFASDIDWK